MQRTITIAKEQIKQSTRLFVCAFRDRLVYSCGLLLATQSKINYKSH
ncbi:hypothetical protein HHE014_03950 [Helicobacter heilmannii]|nr:hypothetical protein HHE014_03950 [Helicobacter heilmannii]